jgi:hypothetical protein
LEIISFAGFKTFKSERRFETADGTDFQEEHSILYSGNFKGLSPSTTPFGKRRFLVGLLN